MKFRIACENKKDKPKELTLRIVKVDELSDNTNVFIVASEHPRGYTNGDFIMHISESGSIFPYEDSMKAHGLYFSPEWKSGR